MSTMTTTDELHDVVLELLPTQGGWTEEEYLWLTDRANRPIEFTDGYIEVLPMPTSMHQAILLLLTLKFFQHLDPRGGKVRFSPLRLRLRSGKFREPDLMVLLDANDPRDHNRHWSWADLVLEVVSPDKPERDLIVKRSDYAETGIPEYLIVNPLNQTIAVLELRGDTYVEHGVFRSGQQATSVLLPDLTIDVDAIFAAK
jgi:Uma2 family endonuclease